MSSFEWGRAAKRLWPVVVVTMVIGLLTGLGLRAVQSRTYESTAQLLFSIQDAASATELNQAATYLERAMTSYAALVETPLVLDPVIREGGLSDETAGSLVQRLTVTVPTSTVLMQITVESPNSEDASRTANAIGNRLIAVVEETSPKTQDGASLRASLVAPAEVPTSPTGLSALVLGGIGGLLGMLAGVGLCVWWVMSRGQIHTAGALGGRVIGRLRVGDDAGPATKGWTLSQETGLLAEDFRALRAALGRTWPADVEQRRRVLVVTSPHDGDGKSAVCAGLARAFAESHTKVTLIDADLRRGTLTTAFGQPDAGGVSDVLSGSATLEESVVPTDDANLTFLGAGRPSDDPSRLLASHDLGALIPDGPGLVIIDSPQSTDLSDAMVLAGVATEALLVASMDRVRQRGWRGFQQRWASMSPVASVVVANRVGPRDLA